MPPSISGDSIRPVGPDRASAVVGDLVSDSAACTRSCNDSNSKEHDVPREDISGICQGHELSEIIPGPQVVQGDLEAAKPRSKLRILAVMTALAATVFITALNSTVVATAIPTICAQLHSESGYAWIGGAFLLANAAVSPVWGKLSGIWGRKPILLTTVALFFAASIICATSTTMKMLIAGRACQGMAGGGLSQLVNITIADMFSLRERSFYMGFIGLIWAIAGAIGPILGGVFTQYLSWRGIFWMNAPICGTAFLLLLLFLDVHNPRTPLTVGIKAVDWFGTISILGLMTMLLLGLDFGGATFPWKSPTVIGLIVAGSCMGGFFFWSERSLAKYPLMPLDIFKEKSNIASLLVAFFHDYVWIGTEYYLPLYFQSSLLASPLRSGTLLIPIIVTESVTGILCGFFIHRTGTYVPLIWIGLILMTIGSSLYTTLNATSTQAPIVGFQVIAGLGTGLLFTPPLLSLQAHVKPEDTATATSTMGFVRNIATCLSVIIGGTVFQNAMAGRSHEFLDAGLSPNLTMALSGDNAAANVVLIKDIADKGTQMVVREAFASSLRYIWITCACMIGTAALCSSMIKGKTLSDVHVEMRTGVRDEKRSVEADGGI